VRADHRYQSLDIEQRKSTGIIKARLPRTVAVGRASWTQISAGHLSRCLSSERTKKQAINDMLREGHSRLTAGSRHASTVLPARRLPPHPSTANSSHERTGP